MIQLFSSASEGEQSLVDNLFTKTLILISLLFRIFIPYMTSADLALFSASSIFIPFWCIYNQSSEYLLIPRQKDENKFIHSLNGLVQCPSF